MHTGVAQTIEQALRHSHLLHERGAVLRCFFMGEQHHDLACAIGHGREPQLHAHTGGVPQGHRHHAGGHALHDAQLRSSAQLVEQGLAFVLAVQQQGGVPPTRGLVGRQQGADLGTLLCRAWVSVGQCARGASRGASAAAHAQIGVDHDLLAAFVRAHGFGRANVDAGAAADLLVAAVCAELLFVGKKAGLFKFTHQLAHLEQRLQVLPVPAEVALRQGVRRKRGRGFVAAQVQHHIKALGLRTGVAAEVNGTRGFTHLDAVAVRGAARQVHLVIEANGLLGASGHTGVAAGAQVQVNRVAGVPRHLESTQPALEAVQATRHHGVTPFLAAPGVAWALRKNRHLHRVSQKAGGAFSGIDGADDEHTAFTFVGDGGHRLGLGQAGGGQQSGDLGCGVRGFTTPTAGFADVDKSDGRDRPFGLLGQL